ncbi:MAG: hypothetical protein R2697_08485 [Ilumatobacteraceae bacterium]
MDNVDPALVIGPSTEVTSATARSSPAIDCHVHLICPQLFDEALAAGITSIVGGGTGPAEGTKATTVTGAWHPSGCWRRPTTGRSTSRCSVAGNTTDHEAMWSTAPVPRRRFKLHED